MPTREQVDAALAEVEDPEIHRPITELGMVKGVRIDGGAVHVDVYLTVAGCPMRDEIIAADDKDWDSLVAKCLGPAPKPVCKLISNCIATGTPSVSPTTAREKQVLRPATMVEIMLRSAQETTFPSMHRVTAKASTYLC